MNKFFTLLVILAVSTATAFGQQVKSTINSTLSGQVLDEKTKQLSIPQSLWRIVEQFAFSEEPNWTALSENYEKRQDINNA